MNPFDDAIALEADGEGRWLGRTSPAYANMVGPFGGITAAQVVAAVLRDERMLGELVAATVNFAAAVADGPFEIVTRVARTNRTTQHWTMEMRQADGAVVTATAVTAVRRATWDGDEARMPDVPPPADVAPAVRGGAMPWTERYEMRFVAGAFPAAFDGREQDDSLTRLWVRDVPPRPVDHASLTALCDVFYPRVWLRRATRVPIGTVSMTIYFHADAARLAATGTGHLLGQVCGQAFHGGFFDQSAQLWDEHGTLLATTTQVVYFR